MAHAVLMAHAEEMRKKKNWRIQRRKLRDLYNPLELPEDEFIAHFRLSKAGYKLILDDVRDLLPASRRNSGVRQELKVRTN